MRRPMKLTNPSPTDVAAPSPGALRPAGRQTQRGRRKVEVVEEAVDRPIALTLKVDQPRYEALKVLGARTRRSNQQILLAALDAYLRNAPEAGPSNANSSRGEVA